MMKKSAASPSVRQREKNVKSTLNKSQTDLRRLAKVGVPDQDSPELKMKRVMKGIVRIGLKPVTPKEAISLRVDADVVAWFKSHGDGYQTRMNSVLKAFRDASV
jgi:uncharacterized protein (DUF4415 family)